MKNKEYLSIKEASEILGVDRTTLRRWDKGGKLKPYRNPLNKYRQYKKEDVIKLAQDTNKLPSDKLGLYLNNYCHFFNEYIHGILFKNYLSDEISILISKRDITQDTFLKVHFLKTNHLLFSIFRLCSPVLGITFPDEATILLRSLFEHISNFLYIYSHDTKEEIDNLINRFFDYGINIAQHKYVYDYNKDLEDFSLLQSNEIKILTNEVNEYLKKYKVLENIDEYKNKYNTKHINTWHGLNTKEFFKCIYNQLYSGECFIFYRKFHTDANAYVHCNIMDYIDANGVIVGNAHKNNTLTVVHHSVLITLGYIEAFFQLIGINLQEKYTKIFDDFDILCTNYYNFMGELNTND